MRTALISWIAQPDGMVAVAGVVLGLVVYCLAAAAVNGATISLP